MSFFEDFAEETSHFDDILAIPGVTLESLMEESEFLQEVRTGNPSLMSYLVEPETFELLLSYVLSSRNEDLSVEKRDKLPFVASEALGCHTMPLSDLLVQADALDFLLDPFRCKAAILPPVAMYSISVLTSVMKKRPAEFYKWLVRESDIEELSRLGSLLQHVSSPHVVAFLKEMLKLEADEAIVEDILDYLAEERLVDALLKRMSPGRPLMDIMGSADVLLAVVQQVDTFASSESVFSPLETEISTVKLVDSVFSATSSNALVANIHVLSALVSHSLSNNMFGESGGKMPNSHLWAELERRTRDMMRILRKPPQTVVVDASLTGIPGTKTIYKSISEGAVGTARLLVIELVVQLVQADRASLNKLLCKEVINQCLSMCFIYPWNNVLHSAISSLVATALSREEDSILFKTVLTPAFVSQLVQAQQVKHAGWHGHLLQMGRSVSRSVNASASIRGMVEEVDGWAFFVSWMSVQTERQSRLLGGDLPVRLSDNEPEFYDHSDQPVGDNHWGMESAHFAAQANGVNGLAENAHAFDAYLSQAEAASDFDLMGDADFSFFPTSPPSPPPESPSD